MQDTKDRERSLITCLQNSKKDSSCILNFIIRFKGISDVAATQKPVYDGDKVSWLAIGLGSKRMIFVDSHLSKPSFLPSLSSSLVSIIMNSELVLMKKKRVLIIILHLSEQKEDEVLDVDVVEEEAHGLQI